MSAYIIFTIHSVHDQVKFQKYGDLAIPVLQKQGVKFFSGPDIKVALENGPVHSTIVLEFPDVAAAQAWYNSEEYVAVRGLRHESAVTTAVIVESWPTAA